MQRIESIDAFQAYRDAIASEDAIGFIPTMGNLHAGHASLIKASLAENDKTIVSLFINPTQFNQLDDFTNYPKTIDADLTLLETLGVDCCLMPSKEAIYPDNYQYQLHELALSEHMEGRKRPGHFTGVLTIVMKLFQLVRPQRAYFGEKDYQQLELIRGMVEAFFMPITIKACPIIREPSGLACSSRNTRLSADARQLADIFARIFHQAIPCEAIARELTAAGIEVEYIEEHHHRYFAAVQIGGVRLIDNRPYHG